LLEDGRAKSLCQRYPWYKAVVVAPVLAVQGFVATDLFAAVSKCCFCI